MHADSDARKGPRSSLGGAQTACAVFSRDGRCIYLGQSKGYLCVLDRDSLQFLDVVRVRPSLPACNRARPHGYAGLRWAPCRTWVSRYCAA